MDAIERAIRNAFEKGDPRDRAFREKVYRSAFAALQRALDANPGLPQEVVEHRRRALSSRISEIESEFIPAIPDAETEAAAPPRPSDATPQDTGPRLEPDDLRHHSRANGRAMDVEAPDGTDRSPRRGGRRAAMLAGAVLLLVAALGAWFAYESFGTSPQQDVAVSEPPVPEQEQAASEEAPEEANEAPRLPGQAESLDDWIAVFGPADVMLVSASGGASAEITEQDGEQFLRIRSGEAGAPVLFDVGQGILEQIAGRPAVFAIVARAEEGQETQISVDCDFGELGDCGRMRYIAGQTRDEFLFEVNLPDIQPSSGGTIAINSDIENTGKAVDIFAIRVSPL